MWGEVGGSIGRVEVLVLHVVGEMLVRGQRKRMGVWECWRWCCESLGVVGSGLHGGGCTEAGAFGTVDGAGTDVLVSLEMVGERGLADETAQTVGVVALELGLRGRAARSWGWGGWRGPGRGRLHGGGESGRGRGRGGLGGEALGEALSGVHKRPDICARGGGADGDGDGDETGAERKRRAETGRDETR